MNAMFFLAASGAAVSPVNGESLCLPKTRNSLPCYYFRRQSAKDGKYVTGDGVSLTVTPERRKKWVDSFLAMRNNGIDVPVVEDHQQKANATLGYVVCALNIGEWYEEVHQYLGEAARDEALKNQISLGIHPNFTDGYGRSYGEAVQHSAVTPVPVIPGQGDAVPIAASLFRLAADVPPGPNALALPEFIRQDIEDAQLVQQQSNLLDAAVRALSNLAAVEGDGGARDLLAQRLRALQLLTQIALRMMQRRAQGFEGIAAETQTMSAERQAIELRAARAEGLNLAASSAPDDVAERARRVGDDVADPDGEIARRVKRVS